MYIYTVCTPKTHTHIKLLISRFLQNPILESLIDFTDPNMNRVASEIFLGEMRDKLLPLKFTFVYNFFFKCFISQDVFLSGFVV